MYLHGVDVVRPKFERATGESLPNRYEVRATDAGRFVRCRETPGLAVSLERRSYSEAEARKLGERVILLDGAGSFGPLIDNNQLLYNLDHHEGCVRAFTLASCEQALMLVAKGLQLDRGAWTVYANEPDLDTMLAIWVLLNHRRVRELTPPARDRLVPLIRLEGAIDANGFDVAEYSGLPANALVETRAVLDRLQRVEGDVKAAGEWQTMDLPDYAIRMLLEVDQIVYEPSDLHDFASVEEEYAHVEIGDDRVAVVCRDASGIYEVEQRLKRVWGDKLGIVALEKERGHYTLRRAAALAKIDLGRIYERFNLLDPAVDGRPPDKRWGGSDEIGGSPRPGGTGLAPADIAKILQDSFRPKRWLAPFARLGMAVMFTLGLAVAAGLTVFGSTLLGLQAGHPQAVEWALVTLLAIGSGAVLVRRVSGGRPWLFGWRRPAGHDWWWLAPAVLAGAVLGAGWTPRAVDASPASLLLIAVVAVAASLGTEIWFRGFLPGLFLLDAKVQRVGGPWFVSRATLVSTALYAATVVAAGEVLLGHSPLAQTPSGIVERAFGAVVAGFALGLIRERSSSILPGVGLQILGSLLLAALRL